MTKVVLKGDSGSHGGSVTEGSSTLTDGGTPVSLLGSSYSCPIHGANPIVSGCSSSLTNAGTQVALDGCVTQCGATITGTGTLTNG